MSGLEVERVDFIGVPVKDLARADEFYGQTLGLRRNPNSGQRWVEYETGNVTLALISPEALGDEYFENFSPNWMPISLRVADVEEARRRLEAAGVKFDRPYGKLPSGLGIAFLTDPWGTYIELNEGLRDL